ncbi:hypothetical protein NDN08_006323 [Rhodosorus marinus]|uniref:Uncharacterized protein n=1 Tax=Rhodosorus marinus TaxID=101924 RepID=A0AAV8UPE5_9RHOD|nr:hypothetical protein NDN08_006323 [Rhodosorus marinus]
MKKVITGLDGMGFVGVSGFGRRAVGGVRVCRGQRICRVRSENVEAVSDSSGGSLGNVNDGGGGGGGGGDGSGDGDGGPASPEVLKGILMEAGRRVQSLPPDLVLAVEGGLMTAAQLQAYLRFDTGTFGFLIRAVKPFRDRFLCDEQFFFKLLAQELIGNGTSLAGEFIERGKDIVDEIEYVVSDLVIGTVVEAAFVWLLAARVPFPSLQSLSVPPWKKLLDSLPASFFEANTAQRSYSLMQRVASVVWVSAQYMAMGFGCGIVGTVLVFGMLEGRKVFQPDYEPLRRMPEVIPNSLGWGLFMASSSNLRFQLVEGIELGLARLLKDQDAALKALIIAIRFANNLYGGVQFVQFFRALGLQDVAD